MQIISPDIAFIDAQYSLSNEFTGHNDDRTGIILGAHILVNKYETIESLKQVYNLSRIIIYNLEQLSNNCPWYTPKYKKLLVTADEVWDYDIENINFLAVQNIRSDVKLHLLNPRSKHFPGCKLDYYPIDVFFYGSLNERRNIIINELRRNNVNVVIGNGLYGDELIPYLCMAKVLLNIHYYPQALQEQARMIRWMAMSDKIISERSKHNYLHINEYDYSNLVTATLAKLKQYR